jgi:UDP-GlcNAc:undecaprenyl-phosphate/decaprenyl-phosphate GlcNAc-1-phosphate transferase
MFDEVNKRSSHTAVATRSGGLAIFLSVFVSSLFCYFYGIELYDYSLLIPLSLLFLIGLYDDIYNMDFKLKFIFQIIAAKIIIDNGLIIDNLHGFMGFFEINRVAAQLLTIFFIVSIINSINFVDGIDGLAISVIVFFIICFEFFSIRETIFINLSVMIILLLTPLLYFNFRKNNKIFLGDSGSLFLGGLASIYCIHILSNNYIINESYDLHKVLYVISILAYPIIDITRIVTLRLYKKISPFHPDKNHIHHIINNLVRSHVKTTTIIICMSLFIMILLQIIF